MIASIMNPFDAFWEDAFSFFGELSLDTEATAFVAQQLSTNPQPYLNQEGGNYG